MIFFMEKKNVREVSFTDSYVFNADEQSAVGRVVLREEDWSATMLDV